MELKVLAAEDRDHFTRVVSLMNRPVSDMSFANLLMWQHVYDIRWAEAEGHLCVFSMGGSGASLFFPPMGPDPCGPVLRLCGEVLRAHGAAALEVEIIREEELDAFAGVGALLQPRSGDYVYETSRMIELPGRVLGHKRQTRNAFVRKYPGARCEVFEAAKHREECLRLFERWLRRDEDSVEVDSKRQREIEAAIALLDLVEPLALPALVLVYEGQLIGVTVGELLREDEFVSLIEKTDRSFNGSAQFIFSEFCRICWSSVRWCNACDDWDVPSLAYTKQSYDPAFRVQKWRGVLRLDGGLGAQDTQSIS
jgi:hypothetical protein